MVVTVLVLDELAFTELAAAWRVYWRGWATCREYWGRGWPRGWKADMLLD
jgi:hypothetical protein